MRSTQAILSEVFQTRNLRQLNELAHFGLRVKLTHLLKLGRNKPDAVLDAEIRTFINRYTKPRNRRSP